jgi:hypothetical protein
VAFELLTEATAGLKPAALLERARGRELASDELSAEALLTSLLEDNQRRIDAGRRPQFIYTKDSGTLSLERAGSPSEAPSLELQAAFAEALGIPLEGGRPVFLHRTSSREKDVGDIHDTLAALKSAVKESRRAFARELRRRLVEADSGTFEKASVRMLHGLGFRELKVAKRSKDGPLLTARRREGSVELRYAIRVWRASATLDRRTVQDLRRDLGHYSAHVGLLLSPQELRGDVRGEAQASGALVLLWCGDALGEKFLEAKAGVRAVQLEAFEFDEGFLEEARRDAEEAMRRREERQREREARGGTVPDAEEPNPGGGAEEPSAGAEDEGVDAGGEVGDEDLEAARAFVATGGEGGESPAAPGQGQGVGRRRRRRRRGRRGRGLRPEGGARPEGAAGSGGVAESTSPLPPPPPPGPSTEGGGAG